jgi:hypothetical protein
MMIKQKDALELIESFAVVSAVYVLAICLNVSAMVLTQ